MSNKNILKVRDINVDKITFDSVRKTQSGAHTVYMKYDGKKPLYIQTPKMTAPYGASTYNDDNRYNDDPGATRSAHTYGNGHSDMDAKDYRSLISRSTEGLKT